MCLDVSGGVDQVHLVGGQDAGETARAERGVLAGLSVYRRNRPGAEFHGLVAAIETDRLFTVPAVRLADAQRQHTDDVWVYRFDWRSLGRAGAHGAHHFLEVPFAFDQLDNWQARGFAGDEPPRTLAATMHAAWTAFVKTGDPNNDRLPPWPRWDPRSRPTMLFDRECTVAQRPSGDEIGLWEGVI